MAVGTLHGRFVISGFLSDRRFIKTEGMPRQFAVGEEAKCLVLCDLASVRVLKDEPYGKLREKEGSRSMESLETQIFNLAKFARIVYTEIPLE